MSLTKVKRILRKIKIQKEEAPVNVVGGIAGSGSPNLDKDQREPGVNMFKRKKSPVMGLYKRKQAFK